MEPRRISGASSRPLWGLPYSTRLGLSGKRIFRIIARLLERRSGGNWFAANLTGTHASGLGRWSEKEISTFLETGHSGHEVAFGSMVTVIENSTQHLRKEDLDAIAHYLKSLPAHKGRTSYKPKPPATQGEIVLIGAMVDQFERPGAGLYAGFCAKCHGDNGTGKSPKVPRLGGNSMVLSENASSLIRQVLEGGKGPLTKNGPKPKEMPSFAKEFTDREIADVLTFVRNSWEIRQLQSRHAMCPHYEKYCKNDWLRNESPLDPEHTLTHAG